MANIYLTLFLSAWCLTPHKTMCLHRNVKNWKTWHLFFPVNLYDHKILEIVHIVSCQTHRSTDEETEARERGCSVQLSASGWNGLEVSSVWRQTVWLQGLPSTTGLHCLFLVVFSVLLFFFSFHHKAVSTWFSFIFL